MTERLKALPDHKRTEESRTLCKELLAATPEDATVCGFFPLRTEPDIRPYLLALLKRKQRVFLPTFENAKLVFRATESLQGLANGALDIPEPPQENEELDRSGGGIIVIVPGRAFDARGNRLGRGAGGYDGWIDSQRSKNSSTCFWGVCLECQIVREIPMEPWDQSMDAVITARGRVS